MSDPISYGDPLAKCLLLSFDRDFGGTWRDTVVRRVYDLWAGLNVRVTDRRPRWWPGVYGTIVIAIDLPGSKPGWCADGTFWLPEGDLLRPRVAFTIAQSDPLTTAATAAHEAGHGGGLLHDDVVGSLMNGTVGVTPSARFTDAHRAQLLARTTRGV